MTNEKFLGWLEGFLDAKSNELNAEDIKLIRQKMSEIINFNYTPLTIPNTYPGTNPPPNPWNPFIPINPYPITVMDNPYIAGVSNVTQTYPSNVLNTTYGIAGLGDTITTKKYPITKTILND